MNLNDKYKDQHNLQQEESHQDNLTKNSPQSLEDKVNAKLNAQKKDEENWKIPTLLPSWGFLKYLVLRRRPILWIFAGHKILKYWLLAIIVSIAVVFLLMFLIFGSDLIQAITGTSDESQSKYSFHLLVFAAIFVISFLVACFNIFFKGKNQNGWHKKKIFYAMIILLIQALMLGLLWFL